MSTLDKIQYAVIRCFEVIGEEVENRPTAAGHAEEISELRVICV